MTGVRSVRANGLRFAYLGWGPEDGPLALLLHGFPDHAPTWRHLGPALGEAGYRAVAPWMRGYAPTEVPSGRDVDLDTLAADVNALHRALGGGADAVLVGHDWGAMAAYRAAAGSPDRWRRIVTMAVPPEPALKGLFRDPRQLLRSWYIGAFQLPGARRLAESDGFALVTRLWRTWSPDHERSDEDVRLLDATLRSPGTMGTAIGYYRGLGRWILRGRYPGGPETVPPMPGLYLHGEDDGAVGVTYAERAREVPGGPRVEIVEGRGHFFHLEDPDEVNRRVIEFLGPAAAPREDGT